jgi:peptidoglycan/LPS O-acetylase OafA/YrhL
MAPFAVSWFFMLSGFIIAYNYPTLPDNQGRTDFLISRVARLWPVHLVTLLFGLTLTDERRWLFWHATLTQTWFTSSGAANAYNGPSWSVSNEIFFYLIYVALLLPPRWLRVVVIVVPISVAIVLPYGHGCFLPPTDPDSTAGGSSCNTLIAQFPPARLIEFLAGVALFHLRPRIPQIIGLSLFVLVFFNFLPTFGSQYSLLSYFVREIEIIIGGGALIAALSRDGWLSKVLSVRPLIIGGEISYAVYMTHMLVILALAPHMKAFDAASAFVVIALVTLALSASLFYCLERPVRNAAKKWTRARTRAKVGDPAPSHTSTVSFVSQRPSAV